MHIMAPNCLPMLKVNEELPIINKLREVQLLLSTRDKCFSRTATSKSLFDWSAGRPAWMLQRRSLLPCCLQPLPLRFISLLFNSSPCFPALCLNTWYSTLTCLGSKHPQILLPRGLVSYSSIEVLCLHLEEYRPCILFLYVLLFNVVSLSVLHVLFVVKSCWRFLFVCYFVFMSCLVQQCFFSFSKWFVLIFIRI